MLRLLLLRLRAASTRYSSLYPGADAVVVAVVPVVAGATDVLVPARSEVRHGVREANAGYVHSGHGERGRVLEDRARAERIGANRPRGEQKVEIVLSCFCVNRA